VALYFGRIRTRIGVVRFRVFQLFLLDLFPINLLLVRSHHVEIIIVKRLIQGRNNTTYAMRNSVRKNITTTLALYRECFMIFCHKRFRPEAYFLATWSLFGFGSPAHFPVLNFHLIDLGAEVLF